MKHLSLFDTALSQEPVIREQQKKRQVFNFMFWARLTGCPVLVLSQYRQFFQAGLQIYSPANGNIYSPEYSQAESATLNDPAASAASKQAIKDGLKARRDALVNTFQRFPYEQGSTRVGIREGGNNQTYKERNLTDLQPNAIMYHYLTAQRDKLDQTAYTVGRATHHQTRGTPRISYEFLSEYVVSPQQIPEYDPGRPYFGQILAGINKLPKSIVNAIRGKGIYISTKEGISITLSITSHNAPVTTYLGLIPGVFIEFNPSSRDKNFEFTTRTVVHEIGHLIDNTVLRATLLGNGIEAIPFHYQSVAFQQLLDERNIIFKRRNGYSKDNNDVRKTNPGYMTNYGESSAEEDFAEHFTYFVLWNKDFSNTGAKEREKKGNLTLQHKFSFMKRLIETPPVMHPIP